MMCKVLFMAHQRSPPLLVGFFEDTGESVYKHFRDDLLAPFLKTNELIQKCDVLILFRLFVEKKRVNPWIRLYKSLLLHYRNYQEVFMMQ